MKVRYAPRFGAQNVEIRDITGGDELATWTSGQERDVDGKTVMFRQPGGQVGPLNAATALFSCGPDFVDASTGKNPNFLCSQCGADALSEHFTDRRTLNVVYLTEDDVAGSPRRCLTCWLAAHPQRIPEFRKNRLDPDILARAQELAQQQAQRAAAPVRASRSTIEQSAPAVPAASTSEE